MACDLVFFLIFFYQKQTNKQKNWFMFLCGITFKDHLLLFFFFFF